MRSRLSSDLALLILAVAVCRSPALAGDPKAKAKAVPVPAAPVKTWEVRGFGVTEADARQNGLESVQKEVKAWLSTHRPEITYSPGVADVESMVREISPAIPRERPNNDEIDVLKGEMLLEVTLKAELSQRDLASFEDQTRQQLAQYRQTLFGKGLVGAVGLLVVATGYLRLEEKVGRHKRKLGLAAVGILGLVGLALLALA
jgi:hypothetical protein